MPVDLSKRTRAVTTPLGMSFQIAPSAALSLGTAGVLRVRLTSEPVLVRSGRPTHPGLCLATLRLTSRSSSTTGHPRTSPPDSRMGMLGRPISTFCSGGKVLGVLATLLLVLLSDFRIRRSSQQQAQTPEVDRHKCSVILFAIQVHTASRECVNNRLRQCRDGLWTDRTV